MEIWIPNRECRTVKDHIMDLVLSYRDWILRRGYYGKNWFSPQRKEVGVDRFRSRMPLPITTIQQAPSPILH